MIAPHRSLLTGLCLIIGACIALNGQAQVLLDVPLAVSNQNPFARVYGLPIPESAQLLSDGHHTLNISLDWASSFSSSRDRQEQVWVDGESSLLTMRWRYRHGAVQWGLDLPFIHQSGGSLDQGVNQWHQFWGLPEANRSKVKRNQLHYFYDDRRGRRRIDMSDNSAGVGDVRLNLALPLEVLRSTEPDPHSSLWSLKAELKLATADSDYLHGSGGNDVSLTMNYLCQSCGLSSTVLQGSWGLMWTEKGDVLADQRESWLVFGTAGLSYRYSDELRLKLQLDAHSASYESDLEELGPGLQLSAGGSVLLSQDWRLDLAIVEDIRVSSTPDVVFHIDLQRGF